MIIVAPSRWLGEIAGTSSLFSDLCVEIIPNGLDTQTFRPIDQNTARELLRIPKGKRILLFGCVNAFSDTRKGVHFLKRALKKIKGLGVAKDLELAVFGASNPPKDVNFGFKTHYLGYLRDDIPLVLAYSASDVFVAPSLQENLSNAVMESLACGTPCVAFDIGGMPDMIEHKKNGYLSRPFDVEALAQGLLWVIEDSSRLKELSERARKKAVCEFDLQVQARRYHNLFERIIGGKEG
jgi:glycosyltransferase involved in cell wall biosynthesis